MIYELAHVIKDRCAFLWNFLEWGNSVAFSLRYRKGLSHLEDVVNIGVQAPYRLNVVKQSDISELQQFFSRQPKDAFAFFQPHGFDERSLRTIVGRDSFLMFVLIRHEGEKEEIVGYAFMRSFVTGVSYRGYMVDAGHRGCGLATIMGYGMNRVGDSLKLKMYKSISPENPASMKATERVCNIEILKTLKNGDYLIRCMSKNIDSVKKCVVGGVNVPSS